MSHSLDLNHISNTPYCFLYISLTPEFATTSHRLYLPRDLSITKKLQPPHTARLSILTSLFLRISKPSHYVALSKYLSSLKHLKLQNPLKASLSLSTSDAHKFQNTLTASVTLTSSIPHEVQKPSHSGNPSCDLSSAKNDKPSLTDTHSPELWIAE